MATNATAQQSAPATKPHVVSNNTVSTIISLETYVSNINKSMMNRIHAFQVELSVGIAIFTAHNAASKEAREMLLQVYSSAGYKCLEPKEPNYKTINRRVNATVGLFEKIGIEKIIKAIGNSREQKAINAIAKHLEDYKLYSINDVFAYAGKPVRVREHKRTPPAPNPQQRKEERRRWSDEERANAKHVDVGAIHWIIPPETRRKDLLEAARRLLELADEFNNGDHVEHKPLAVH